MNTSKENNLNIKELRVAWSNWWSRVLENDPLHDRIIEVKHELKDTILCYYIIVLEKIIHPKCTNTWFILISSFLQFKICWLSDKSFYFGNFSFKSNSNILFFFHFLLWNFISFFRLELFQLPLSDPSYCWITGISSAPYWDTSFCFSTDQIFTLHLVIH